MKSSATAEQLQMAYFDRRSELFALLASIDSEQEQDDITASHRFHAERKMDAVVMAVRILGDPELRQEYDNVMSLRQNGSRKQPKEPPQTATSPSREPDGVYAGVPHDEEPPPPSPRVRKSPKRRSPRGSGGEQQEQERQHFYHHHEIKNSGSSDHRSSSNSGGDDVDDNDEQQPPQLLADDSSDSRFMHVTPPSPKPPKKYHKHPKNKHASSSKKERSKEKSKKKHHHHPTPPPPPPAPVDQSVDQSTLVDDETFQDNTTLNDTLEEGTIDTRTWADEGATIESGSTYGNPRGRGRRLAKHGGHSSTLSTFTNQGGLVSRIQEEVAGTVEDTLVSFEQVMNVFTLQEKDIRAVMGRIDKAKKQLKKRR